LQLHAILSARRTPVPLEDLMARLECSRATLYRAVNALKDQLNAPIVFDADAGGFLYRRSAQAETYELPGLWFSAAELQALTIMQRLLKDAAVACCRSILVRSIAGWRNSRSTSG
jgi:proteasome accessory factor C